MFQKKKRRESAPSGWVCSRCDAVTECIGFPSEWVSIVIVTTVPMPSEHVTFADKVWCADCWYEIQKRIKRNAQGRGDGLRSNLG